MATVAAKGRMAAIARQRIAESGPHLAARLGIAWPDVMPAKDRDIAHIRELEAFATFLETAFAASGALIDGAVEQIAALRQQITDELLASLPADDSEGEATGFDIVAAYEAYRADKRANGDEDQFAFQDAVLGVFGVSVATCPDDCGCTDGECARESAVEAEANDAEPKPAKPKRTRSRKAAD